MSCLRDRTIKKFTYIYQQHHTTW